jgi:hypothetical protein
MGMLNRDLGKPFADHFRDDQVFELEDAKVGPEVPTKYGPNRPALLLIGGEWYSLWGQAVVAAVRDLEPGELPAKVKVIRQASRQAGHSDTKMIVAADWTPDQAPAGDSGDIPF